MKIWEVPELEGNEFFKDVNERVTRVIAKGLKQCYKEYKDIDYEALRAYCLEFFTLPEITIDNAIKEARRRLDGNQA